MTRINCIPVEELVNKHLLAEYKELPRAFKLARQVKDAPKEYTLGKGHVLFFYDKLIYLRNRHKQLCKELIKRKYNIKLFTPIYDELIFFKPLLCNDWIPDNKAMQLNRKRINERLREMK